MLKMAKFKVGDRVRVISSGKTYSTYDTWAQKYKLENWKEYETLRDGDMGQIIAMGKHDDKKTILCAVKKQNGHPVIIAEDGLELVQLSQFKVGYKIKIRSNLSTEDSSHCGIVPDMVRYGGKIATIIKISRDVDDRVNVYRLDIDNGDWEWDITMLEDFIPEMVGDWNYALKELEKGNKVRRAHWSKSFYLRKESDGFIYEMDSNRKWNPKISSFNGTDWEMYEDKEWEQWECLLGDGEWVKKKEYFNDEYRGNMTELSYNFGGCYDFYIGETEYKHKIIWRKKRNG
jgi:hypothetical protein